MISYRLSCKTLKHVNLLIHVRIILCCINIIGDIKKGYVRNKINFDFTCLGTLLLHYKNNCFIVLLFIFYLKNVIFYLFFEVINVHNISNLSNY